MVLREGVSERMRTVLRVHLGFYKAFLIRISLNHGYPLLWGSCLMYVVPVKSLDLKP